MDVGRLPARTTASDASSVRRYGLGRAIEEAYERCGIRQLYLWQQEVLASPGVLEGKSNLIYTADTSAGKTLVAEILVLRRLVEGGARCKALFVLPFKALVAQKTAYFERLLEGSGLSVKPYFGGSGELPVPRRLNLAVCTIEKANLVVQSMADQGRLSELVSVVIDEAHMLGDSRGAVLERLLAKLLLHGRRTHLRFQQQQRDLEDKQAGEARDVAVRPSSPEAAATAVGCTPKATEGATAASAAASGAVGAACSRPPQVAQLVGMSATLPNTSELADWWGNTLVHEVDFRPTPLLQRIVTSEGALLDSSGQPLQDEPPLFVRNWPSQLRAAAEPRQLAAPPAPMQPPPPLSKVDPKRQSSVELLTALSEPICRQGRAVLIFCSTKLDCQTTARELAAAGVVPMVEGAADALINELEQACTDGVNPQLVEAIRGGTAWHHAGLSDAERKVDCACAQLPALTFVAGSTPTFQRHDRRHFRTRFGPVWRQSPCCTSSARR